MNDHEFNHVREGSGGEEMMEVQRIVLLVLGVPLTL